MASLASKASYSQLTVAERILLVQDIWDSIADSPESLELSDEHRQIIDARLADYHCDPRAGSSWEQVKARILHRP